MLGKYDSQSDECIFLVYSLKSRAYRCYNLRTKAIVESASVRVDEKFKIQERIVDYNFDDEYIVTKKNDEVFFETNNDLENEGELR